LIQQGWSVRILSRKSPSKFQFPSKIEVFQGDLTKPDMSRLDSFVNGCDAVFHCAGEIIEPALMRPLHVDGTAALAAASAGRIGRWVQLSSTGVYGAHRIGTVSENTKVAPLGVYEETKFQAEQIVVLSGAEEKFECVILRPSIVFGEDMPNQSLRQLLHSIRNNRFFFIGTPGSSANFIHVKDLARAMVDCATNPNAIGKVYNVSGWTTFELFVGALAEGAGVATPRIRLPETPVRLAVSILSCLPGVPLTAARVDAMTGRTRYAVDAIQQDVGFVLTSSLEESARNLAKVWSQRCID
jgi:nucleoside-diphosphate-sugar epimerase